RNNESATRVHGHSYRTAAGRAVAVAETSHEIHRRSGGTPVLEGHEHHLVAHRILAVPATMFADKDAVSELRTHLGVGESDAQRRHMRSQTVIGLDRRGDLFRVLRLGAFIHILAPITVRPAIKAAFPDSSQIVGDE